MTVGKKLSTCICFARFAAREGVDPAALAELAALATKAHRAGEREANTGKSADKQRERFEAKAAALGYATDWPGLWPVLHRNGVDVYLPDF